MLTRPQSQQGSESLSERSLGDMGDLTGLMNVRKIVVIANAEKACRELELRRQPHSRVLGDS